MRGKGPEARDLIVATALETWGICSRTTVKGTKVSYEELGAVMRLDGDRPTVDTPAAPFVGDDRVRPSQSGTKYNCSVTTSRSADKGCALTSDLTLFRPRTTGRK